VTIEQHMVSFEQFTNILQAIQEDVFMINLCQCLHGYVGLWFRHLEDYLIDSWVDLHDALLR
jgi:hypothetical protein